MSEDAAGKRYDATPARIERAKRDGNRARSSELCGVAAFGGGLIALIGVLAFLAAAAANALRAAVAFPIHRDLAALVPLVSLAFVPALGAAAGGTMGALAQSGGLRVSALKFTPHKLAPIPGLKRMFGGEAAVGAVRGALAFAVVSAMVAPVLIDAIASAGAASSPIAAAHLARDGMLRAGFAACATGVLFAVADFALAHRRWLKGLKMDFDELKRDMKEQDGDPQAKSRRKAMHRSFARGSIARTCEASFVVVNPTHIAIAIRYRPPAIAVPEILVRAVDERAREVRALATRAAIPVIEDVPLARWLFRVGDAGHPIPQETFVAVAEVIASLVRSGAMAE